MLCAQPRHHVPEVSLPHSGYCRIKSSSKAKDDSYGAALSLLSTLPSSGLAPHWSIGESCGNTAAKDVILIPKIIDCWEHWSRGKQVGWASRSSCCPYPLALALQKAGEAGRLWEVCLSGLHLAALAGFVPCLRTVQESVWEMPTPLQSNSKPVSSASISHLLLIVKTSPRGVKEQIFPSFGLGTFPCEQLIFHTTNTFRSLKDFPGTCVICQLTGDFLCFFLPPHIRLPSKGFTESECLLALPCFRHSFFPFPLLQPFLSMFPSFPSAVLVALTQRTK